MKKISVLSVLLLLLTVSLIMTACMNKATEGSQSTNENAESDTLSEELKKQIVEDFVAYEFGDNYVPMEHGIFRIERYYGSYDGAVAVMLRGSKLEYTSAFYSETVAGSIIRCNYGNSVMIWKDGSFFTMQEAYDQGILTAEQVAEIANYRYVEYPTDF